MYIKMADFEIELVAWWSKDGGHGVMNTGAEENSIGSEGDDAMMMMMYDRHVCTSPVLSIHFQLCSICVC